jgi:hypothetical protein
MSLTLRKNILYRKQFKKKTVHFFFMHYLSICTDHVSSLHSSGSSLVLAVTGLPNETQCTLKKLIWLCTASDTCNDGTAWLIDSCLQCECSWLPWGGGTCAARQHICTCKRIGDLSCTGALGSSEKNCSVVYTHWMWLVLKFQVVKSCMARKERQSRKYGWHYASNLGLLIGSPGPVLFFCGFSAVRGKYCDNRALSK